MAPTPEIRDDRRNSIISLILKGMTRASIAKKYNITTRTVDSDIKSVKKKIAKRLAKLSKHERLSEYEETSRMRNVQLWKIILGDKSNQRQILRAVELLQREDILKIKRDQMVGLFPKEDMTLNLTQYNLNTADKIQIEFEDLNNEEKVIDVKVEDDDGK